MADHSRSYYALVRRQVMKGLREKGVKRLEARRIAYRVTSDEIDAQSRKSKVGSRNVSGPFIDWFIENQATILQVISAIVAILLMFAKRNDMMEKGDKT